MISQFLVGFVALVPIVLAQQGQWQQCMLSEVALFYLNDWLNYDWTSPGGGIGWTGETTCVSGLVPPISLFVNEIKT